MHYFQRFCLVALVLFVATATAAKADGIEVKVKGEWDFAFGNVWRSGFKKWDDEDRRNGHKKRMRHDDTFGASQRVRTQANFIASEYLQAVLMFEIGDIVWGSGGTVGQGAGGQLDTDGVNVETKRAYLDWLIPETEIAVRMGLQGLGLPMGNGWDNPIFSADVAGVVVSSPICDFLEGTLFWVRPFDQYANDSDGSWLNGKNRFKDEMDMFGLTLPVSGEGWSVTPWFMYALIGNASGYFDYIMGEDGVSLGAASNRRTASWWAGLSTEISILEPLTFSLDAMYGHLRRTKLGVWNVEDEDNPYKEGSMHFGTSGWFIAAALNYELEWGAPGVYGWWASGDKKDADRTGKYGRIPVVGVDDGFAATSFGFPGSAGIGADTAISATGAGTWGVAVQIADMSFIEDLSHTLRFAFYSGTNSDDLIRRNNGWQPFEVRNSGAESLYLTKKDRAYEVNFDHTYQIYENLAAIVELGYIHLDLDKDTWKNHKTNDAVKAQLLFQYTF